MQDKYFWVLYVGDDPDDEICLGPYKSNKEAHKHCDSYHTNRAPEVYHKKNSTFPESFMIGYNGQISSVYICYQESKPSYLGDILPVLKEHQS